MIAPQVAQITTAPEDLHGGKDLDEGCGTESCRSSVGARKAVSRLKPQPAFFGAILFTNPQHF